MKTFIQDKVRPNIAGIFFSIVDLGLKYISTWQGFDQKD